jgi:thioesterase domain-containing protein/acyl carrier protein
VTSEVISSPGRASTASRSELLLPYAYSEPETEVDRLVCKIISDIARVAPVGMDDDFYDLGGDSLMGEHISMEIQRLIGREFPMSKLFECPTPRLISNFLAGDRTVDADAKADKKLIFVVHGRGGYTAPRPQFYSGLSESTKLVMFELPGLNGGQKSPRTIRDVAKAYVAQIERDYPVGPVRLAAFCVGGVIAIEMARQLRALGRDIAGIVLLDPRVPERLLDRHKALRKIESNPEAIAPKILYRLNYGPLEGGENNLFDRLRDALLMTLRFIAYYIQEHWKLHIARRGDLFRYQHLQLKLAPRVWLITAYRFIWPSTYHGHVHVLASEQREARIKLPGSIWDRFIPNRTMEIVARKHGDIGDANAKEVAARMEAILQSS